MFIRQSCRDTSIQVKYHKKSSRPLVWGHGERHHVDAWSLRRGRDWTWSQRPQAHGTCYAPGYVPVALHPNTAPAPSTSVTAGNTRGMSAGNIPSSLFKQPPSRMVFCLRGIRKMPSRTYSLPSFLTTRTYSLQSFFHPYIFTTVVFPPWTYSLQSLILSTMTILSPLE